MTQVSPLIMYLCDGSRVFHYMFHNVLVKILLLKIVSSFPYYKKNGDEHTRVFARMC